MANEHVHIKKRYARYGGHFRKGVKFWRGGDFPRGGFPRRSVADGPRKTLAPTLDAGKPKRRTNKNATADGKTTLGAINTTETNAADATDADNCDLPRSELNFSGVLSIGPQILGGRLATHFLCKKAEFR